MFNYTDSKKTISEIYEMFSKGELVADDSYQRRIVWLEKDMVRLIETILLHLVIPELYFWKAETDPDTGRSITHIVDGQQRIKAICAFINNDFKLTAKYLLDKEMQKQFGDKSFQDFSSEEKKVFWNYQLMIIDIDVAARKTDIVDMFYRLNLTNYSLNAQEKRNSKSGEFGDLAREISENDIWDKYRLFAASDIRRMKDVEFCASLIILLKKGIVDQTDQTELNQAYEEMNTDYKEKSADKKDLLKAIKCLDEILDDDSMVKFARRKSQLYTVFSILFYMDRENISLNKEFHSNMCEFVKLYSYFSNGIDLGDLDDNEKIVLDWLKKYKLASSEGIHKHTNRMIRFNVMRNFLFDMTDELKKSRDKLFGKLLSCSSPEKIDYDND